MKKQLTLGALVIAAGICLPTISVGHGGTYRGPGDTVPPGGGGGGGGGAGPSTPSPSGPSTGGPSGPSTPTPAGPGASTGGPSAAPKGPSTGGASGGGTDLTLWEFWWGFNKDAYLNLKAAIYTGVVTGGDDFFLGGGTTKQAKNSLKPSEEAIRQKIVPALKEALEKERANDIVTGALIALGKIGDAKNEQGESEFESIISKFLSSSSQEIAETAAVALGILANDASVATLKSLALDLPEGRKLVGSNEVNYRSRAFATYGLGLIGNRTASNQTRQEIATILVDILNKPDTSTRDVKVAALISMGLVPIAPESGEAADGKTSATSSRQAEIKYITKFFKDENNHSLVRAHAPTALARLLDKDAPQDLREGVAKMLVEALGDHSKERDEVQQSCVLALGQIGDTDKDKLDKEIRDTLMRISDKSPDIQAKNFAMIALAQIGGRQGPGEDNDSGVKDVRGFLLTNLTKGRSHIKPWAGVAIGVMERAILDSGTQSGQTPSGVSKDQLRVALKEAASPDHQGAFAIGCGIAKDTEAKNILMDKLDNASGDQARGYAAVALGLIGDRDAIKKIEAIVKDSKYKPELLKQTAIGLGLLGDKDLVQELVGYLREAKGLATQAAIASALGFIGDSRSIDPLVEMLKKKEGITDSARGFAAVALGIVADKEPLPWNSKISTNINYRANTTTLTGETGTGILDIL